MLKIFFSRNNKINQQFITKFIINIAKFKKFFISKILIHFLLIKNKMYYNLNKNIHYHYVDIN